MLALKTVLAKSERLPILVFDEIDSGISGAVARRAGESMRRLAAYHQIIAITHLPQIASLGDTHFVVEKEVARGRTRTRIRRLDDEAERAEAVARLLSGDVVSDAAMASARELIEAGRGMGDGV
jgi:DNA repair protein RecN (Recombination protein N)